MIDFKALMTPEMIERAKKRKAEYEESILGRGVIQGISSKRGHDPRVVDLKYEIRISVGDEPWVFILNGSTGYEGMPFNRIPVALECKVPWPACFGCSTYDKLDVPWEELKKVWEAHPELRNYGKV